MSRYIMRLDDASEYMDAAKWEKMENLLDKYKISPIVGVIPENQDPDMIGVYRKDCTFWNKVHSWNDKGWTIALHGYSHVFETNCGGINPVNDRSEFAGLSLENQKEKVRLGYAKLMKYGIKPSIFFAPAHTFDENTLRALKEESDICIISDTIANDVYYQSGFYFIPQQSGHVRKLPFKLCTFCYHPNIMTDEDFIKLEDFLEVYGKKYFVRFSELKLKKKKATCFDKMLKVFYFARRYGKGKK